VSGNKGKPDKGSPFFALNELKDRMAREAEAAKAKPDAGKKAPSHAVAQQKGRGTTAQPKRSGTVAEHDEDVESFHRMMMGVAPMPTNKPARAGAEPTKNLRANEIQSRAAQEAEEARERLAALAMASTWRASARTRSPRCCESCAAVCCRWT
jgi:aldehyde:ferredoxin oxidoreductase